MARSARQGRSTRVRDVDALRRFHEHWVDIVLTVASIIQGLALTQLATSIPGPQDPVRVVCIVVAFAVVIRIFQTYVAAALAYDDWVANFFDIVLIFSLGIVEYQFIHTLVERPFSVSRFEVWLAIIAGLALVGYANALRFIRGNQGLSKATSDLESRTQRANLSGSGIVLAIALVLAGGIAHSVVLVTILAVAQMMVIFANTYWSVRLTLEGVGARESDDNDDSSDP